MRSPTSFTPGRFHRWKPPCRAAFLAIKRPENAATRDREADLAHLLKLLDRYGRAAPPARGDALFRHHRQASAEMGEPHRVRHLHGSLPRAWPTRRSTRRPSGCFPRTGSRTPPACGLTSALVRVELLEDEAAVPRKMAKWFVPESLAVSRVIDDTAIIASDFRIDNQGHMRMAVFARPGIGQRRIGRVVQRLCEIETYKTMSMLGLARVRSLGPRLAAADEELTQLIEQMAGETVDPDQTLKSLLAVAAELEKILAQCSFRFGATGAYEALVNQRIAVLREERFEGRQTFGEFMMRRFDPAMRTVKASERRLQAMADRAAQAGNLLRTRVDCRPFRPEPEASGEHGQARGPAIAPPAHPSRVFRSSRSATTRSISRSTSSAPWAGKPACRTYC